MSPKSATQASPAIDWTADGSIVGRVVGVIEQVVVSSLPQGKVLFVKTAGGEVSVNLDAAAATHVGRLLLDLPPADPAGRTT